MDELKLFDYAHLTPEVREMVQEHTGEIRTLTRRAAEDIVEIGQRLIEVKAALVHGGFGPWLKTEFGWSHDAANKFMRVAEQFKFINFMNLDIAPSALYALASGSTPDFIRAEIVEMAEATGQPVTHKAVKERLEAHYADAPAVLPEQDAPALPALVDNAPMPAKPKKAEPIKAKKVPYKPLETDLEERELMDGTLVMVPKLPETPKHLEIKNKDWEKAARRFENAAGSVLTLLGQLSTYHPDTLRELCESPEGRSMGAGMRVSQVQDSARALLKQWGGQDAETKTIDAAPLFEREKDRPTKTLDLN